MNGSRNGDDIDRREYETAPGDVRSGQLTAEIPSTVVKSLPWREPFPS